MSIRIHGNRLIDTPTGLHTRPTPAKVRTAIFNIWQFSITGSRWLDLCAGSGSISAQALCQGANLVVAIEKSPQSCTLIRKNLSKVAPEGSNFIVLQGDVIKLLPNLEPSSFDFIYFDPPYDQQDLYISVLQTIALQDILTPNGEIAVEHSSKNKEFPPIDNLEIIKQKTYGSTTLTLIKKNI